MSGFSLSTNSWFKDPRLPAWFVLAGGTTAIAVAFLFQYGLGLEPCHLCIWQRWPYVIAVAATIAGLVTRRPIVRSGLLGLAAVALTTCLGIALYQIGLQHGLWATAACEGGAADALAAENVGQALSNAEPSACAEVTMRILGLSIPEWNAVASAVLAVIAGTGSWMAWKAR